MKKQVSLAQGRFGRPRESNVPVTEQLLLPSKAFQPPLKYSDSLKAIPMHRFVAISECDEACMFGRSRAGRQWSTTLRQP